MVQDLTHDNSVAPSAAAVQKFLRLFISSAVYVHYRSEASMSVVATDKLYRLQAAQRQAR